MKITAPLAILGIVGTITLTACGGGSQPGSDGGVSTPAGTNGGDFTSVLDSAAPAPVTIPGATRGGTVTVLSQSGLSGESLDPTAAYVTDAQDIDADLITRALTQWKYDPKTGRSVLVPDLATDLGRHNADYTVWRFTLRPGVKWQDGTPVTVQQLEYGIERSFDPETFSQYGPQTYTERYFLDDDGYEGPYLTPHKADHALSISGDTLTIRMKKPFPDMPYLGAMPAMGAVPTDPAISAPKRYSTMPFSDGPYQVRSDVPGKELVLVRNRHWDPATDPGRTQYPAEYDFRSGQGREQIDQILLADTGDGRTSLSYDSLSDVDYQKLKSQDPSQLAVGSTPCTEYYAPDYTKITDIRVRRALGLAFPYQDAMLGAGAIPDATWIPATSLLPPGTPGRVDYRPLGVPANTTDVAAAKKLLTQAGAVGFKVVWPYLAGSTQARQIAQSVAASFDKAGFDADPVPVAEADWWNTLLAKDGTINLRESSWCSDWPSGLTWFPDILKGENPKNPTIDNNMAVFDEKSVDAEMTTIEALPLPQQAAAWGRLDREIETKYYPIIPISYDGVATAHGSAIQGDTIDPAYGMPNFKGIWVRQ